MQIFRSGRFPDLLGQMAAVQGSVGAHGAVSSLCAQTLQHCYHWSGLPGVGADSLVWGWEPRELTGFDERWLEDETVSPPQSH